MNLFQQCGVAARLSSACFDTMLLRAGLDCCTDGFDGDVFDRGTVGVGGYMYLGVVCSLTILRRRGRKNEREDKKASRELRQDRMREIHLRYVKNACPALRVTHLSMH